MKINEITSFLEAIAPLGYQEDYDNAGLIVGNPNAEVNSAMISLDCTEAVVDEAIQNGCKLIISHHPIVFRGLKKLNGSTYVERVVMKAIKHDIALYAIHTNYDNVADGVNRKICDILGLKNCSILSQKSDLRKLVTFCPLSHAIEVRDALFAAGAGQIGNYSECSFNIEGTGTFKASDNADPYVGQAGERHHEAEVRIETIYPKNIERKLLVALLQAHPYEEVAYDCYDVANANQGYGSGMIGWLDRELSEGEFLGILADRFKAKAIRHTALRNKPVKRVAVCGGAGSFLLKDAIRAGADFYVSADFKYHEFFDADGHIVIADIGHFESEQFTQDALYEIITKKFPNFALRLTNQNTNPINYYI